MTKKEISTAFDIFTKAHNPDDFKSLYNAVHSFWGDLHGFVHRYSKSNFNQKVARWWWSGKSPLSEAVILSSMDTKYVTHRCVQVHDSYCKFSEATNSNVIEVMFDLSFKYNIIGVAQKPGDLRIWIKESEDHQTNISGEVVEKIAKCLEY